MEKLTLEERISFSLEYEINQEFQQLQNKYFDLKRELFDYEERRRGLMRLIEKNRRDVIIKDLNLHSLESLTQEIIYAFEGEEEDKWHKTIKHAFFVLSKRHKKVEERYTWSYGMGGRYDVGILTLDDYDNDSCSNDSFIYSDEEREWNDEFLKLIDYYSE